MQQQPDGELDSDCAALRRVEIGDGPWRGVGARIQEQKETLPKAARGRRPA